MKQFKSKWPRVLMFVLLIGMVGCFSGEQTYYKSGQRVNTTVTSKADVMERLNDFVEVFTNQVKTTAFEIDQGTDDPKMSKMSLLWRTRSVAAMNSIQEQSEAMAVLVDTWCLCIRQREFFENGYGSDLFGPSQQLAINTSVELERGIHDLASDILGEKLYTETEKNVRTFALSNPIQSGFSKMLVYSTETRAGQQNPFQSVMSIPLSPFKAFQGVEQTPAAIYDFSGTTRHLTDVIEQLPESTRWQLLMLLYEIEESNLSKSLTENVEAVKHSSDQIAGIFQNLPDVIEQIDDKQSNVQRTLQEAQKTLNETRTFLGETRTFLADSQSTLTGFSEVAANVEKTAQAWDAAAESTEAVIQLIKQKQPREPGSPPPMNLQATAEAISEAAAQLQKLNDALPATLDMTENRFRSISTMIAWRVAWLLILLFALLITYRIVCVRSKIKQQSQS